MGRRFAVWLWLLLLMIAVNAAPQTKEINISGVWSLTLNTERGDWTMDVTFAQEKDVLKVTMAGPQGETVNGTGTVKDNLVEWAMTFSSPQGDFKIVYKGKAEGENLSGEVQMGDFGSAKWTATKKK